MDTTKSNGNPLRFSSFEVDVRAGELRKHGVRVKLQDQPFQILVSLLEKPGEVVTREELRERLWPADTFVDFDHSLNSAVKKLRQALSDDPDVPRFIETLPRRGYRFIAPLRSADSSPVQGAQIKGGGPREIVPVAAAEPAVVRLHHWKLWASGGLGFIVALGLVAWFGFSRAQSSSANAPIRLVPLTTYTGAQSKPSFSPDGNQVAFAWEGDKQDRVDIYIKQIGTEKPLQVTQDFGFNFLPAWSPDGRYIAFFHADRDQVPGIYLTPALGGSPRKLRDLQHPHDCNPNLSWSPDGKFLAYSEKAPSNMACSVYALSVEDLQVRKLSSPPEPSAGDGASEYSPDGKSIAFIRNTKDVEDIYVMASAGGEARRITFDNRLLAGLAWTPDSKEIIFSSNRGGASWGLWRIAVRGGVPERVAVGSDRAMMPTVSLKGHRLAYANGYWTESIWRMPIGPARRGGKPEKLISSSMQEEGPQYSPDGKRIAFQSTRSGSFEIWRADADGSNAVQLTSFGGPLTGTPRWSPDGRSIAFDSRPGSHPNIHVVSADGGPVRRFNNDTSDDGVPSWSHDGKWIYFASDRSGGWQVWKMPVDGGPATQITKTGGFAALESPDGKWLYYAKFNEDGIWRVAVDGGPEMKVLDYPPHGYWGYFAVASDGLYFVGPGENKDRPAVNFLNFATQRVTRVAEWEKEKGPFQSAPGMALSPDGRSILFVQLDEARNNLMLAENFR